MSTAIMKQWIVTGSARPSKGNEAEMLISTPTLDRDRDRVMPEGVNLTNATRNLPVLFAHDYKSLPVGTATAFHVSRDGIRAKWRWLEHDPFADRVRNAFDQGVLRGASIGFRPIRSVPNEHGGHDHLTWELLEFSLVPIGANQDAVRTLKGLGLTNSSLNDRISAQITTDLLAHLCHVFDEPSAVLDIIDDDHVIDVPLQTLQRMCREAAASALADLVTQELQDCLDRKRGRIRDRDCIDVIW